ncbi:hypothetical protein GCM10027444_11380 [Actinopolyspora lacussalsi]
MAYIGEGAVEAIRNTARIAPASANALPDERLRPWGFSATGGEVTGFGSGGMILLTGTSYSARSNTVSERIIPLRGTLWS